MLQPTDSLLRILCSKAERAPLTQALAQAPFAWRLQQPEQAFDIAFISRDITGKSTKFRVEPETAVYYDALRRNTRLRWVHVHSAGADRQIYLDLAARGVSVTTSQGASDAVVAQTALAGLLSLARKLPLLARQQREHPWQTLDEREPRDLAGQHAVIVGWGGIGQRIGASLKALGMSLTVLRNSDTPVAEAERSLPYDRVAEALPGADWLILACPLTARTQNLINREALALLPAHAMLINVARGHVVDETALIERLSSARLAGAFLDVFQQEPLPADSALWDLDNVIVTPHSAAFSSGNADRVRGIFLDNIRRLARGEPLRNLFKL
ncbi:D-2-hydroxyacid dehydrogenase [Bordetella holmesii]|uniref:4-phosphoerythronate dehydrogenase n=3 Tax=Bordetella holmesii TaxID=35814 RepID=A0A158M287_9BORD|nr:D-2-hydroxyacid dehydrogenase [Bordetella holmesii]AIT28020.1 D-isomer specific 2-hydroxyacid dehydrogenase, NAD binding domain protein [Bordetella holmesii 44057]EWM40795.1 D-isomer specific 2-hydroxyacid dehydrogenase, NAD binding domain protein [Bordetella holmesii 35009]EWM42586.1 D-isomer specific 2-hydroxyacid dehydrogenase, NAD binding domain protein [Bordetella holmesii 41130]ABF59706.1 putative dehydrogenase [Bordetella holmesii]AMD46744.1 hydroxyacid dehydrogenase [Bordetella holm